jgi:hypothetical protein
VFPQLFLMVQCTQDFILGNHQPSLRDYSAFLYPTQDFILGYFQSSLRDSCETPFHSVHLEWWKWAN